MSKPSVTFHPLTPALAHGERNEVNLLIRVTPPPSATQALRPPLNVALVIDRSSSMRRAPMHTAREAAKAFVQQLRPTDRVAIVTFDSRVEVPVPSTLATDPAVLCDLIDHIHSRGSTALFAGWMEGATQVAEHLQPAAMNRVVILSDGHANIGPKTADEITPHVRALTQRGISTSAFGIGDRYDETLLEGISLAGDGNYAYIEQLDQLEAALTTELGELSATLGRLVSLGVEPNASLDVTLVDVLNDYQKTDTGRYMLPSLIAGVPVEVLLRLHVPATATQASSAIAVTNVRIAWTDPRTGTRQVQRAQLDLPVLPAPAARNQIQDAQVHDRLTRLEIARAKDEAVRFMDRGDFDSARASVASARGRILQVASPAVRTSETHDLDALDSAFNTGQSAKARKLASSQSYTRKRRMDHE